MFPFPEQTGLPFHTLGHYTELKRASATLAQQEQTIDYPDQSGGFPWGYLDSSWTNYAGTFSDIIPRTKLEGFILSKPSPLRICDFMGMGTLINDDFFTKQQRAIQMVSLGYSSPEEKGIHVFNSALLERTHIRGDILDSATWRTFYQKADSLGGFDIILNRSGRGFKWALETLRSPTAHQIMYSIMGAAANTLATGGLLLSDTTQLDRNFKANLQELDTELKRRLTGLKTGAVSHYAFSIVRPESLLNELLARLKGLKPRREI